MPAVWLGWGLSLEISSAGHTRSSSFSYALEVMPDTIPPGVDVIDHGQAAGDAEVGVSEQLQGVEALMFCIRKSGAPEVAKLIEPSHWARSRDPSPRNLGGRAGGRGI